MYCLDCAGGILDDSTGIFVMMYVLGIFVINGSQKGYINIFPQGLYLFILGNVLWVISGTQKEGNSGGAIVTPAACQKGALQVRLPYGNTIVCHKK